MKKVRLSNFELMRIVSTFFIVLWHVILCGEGLENISSSTKLLFDVILSIIAVHVNSYILLNGYFGCKKVSGNKKGFLNAISISWFYRILIVVGILFIGNISLTKLEIIQDTFILPLNHEHWFIHHYLLLCLISPFLNKLIKSISQSDYKKLIMILVIINSIIPYATNQLFFSVYKGFSLYHFVLLYLIGGYLSMYPIKESYHFRKMSNSKYRNILIASFILISFINLLIVYFGDFVMSISVSGTLLYEFGSILRSIENTYDFILTIIQSIVYVLIFSTLSFKSNIINKIAKLTLGIYVIHESELLKPYIYEFFKFNSLNNSGILIIGQVFLVTIIIFVVCGIIEMLRIYIFKLLKRFTCFLTITKNSNLHNKIKMVQ